VVAGLTQSTTALDLLQAITEAAYQRLARIAELLMEQEETPPKFLVSGGIQHSKAAMQRLADVLNQSIYANPEPEASIRGAAVFAIEKLGRQPKPLKLPRPFPPRKKYAALYAQERTRQINLEDLFTQF
jgi:gluconokinase